MGINKAQPVDNYQAESDCHTLMRAEEVKGDKKRHAAAKKHAKKQVKQMSKVAMNDKDRDDMEKGYRG